MKYFYTRNFKEFTVKFILSYMTVIFSSIAMLHAVYTTRTGEK